jgi:hypothetical protein
MAADRPIRLGLRANLPQFMMLVEIQRFDRSTDATVIVYGFNDEGEPHVSLRVVPLDAVPPWWTLLIVLVVGAVGLRARRRGWLESRPRRGAAAAVTLVAAAPATVLGWHATTTIVAVVGGGAGLLLASAIWFMRPQAKDQDTVDDLDAQDLVDLGL